MKKIIKFSKNYDMDMFKIKKNFYSNNSQNLMKKINMNKIYKKQKKRDKCQNCVSKIGLSDFKSFGIDYIICRNCGHLNGKFQNSFKFAHNLYSGQNSKIYSLNYARDFHQRVKNIYRPKIKFLKKVIKKKFNITDIGSGGGHFLKACELEKINATGFETSNYLVNIAKKFIKKNKIKNIIFEDINKIIENNDGDCVSLIGVLEHLVEPDLAIESFKKSKSKFLFISVPLFSFSSFLEHANPNIFPRQLGGDHTHLYTEKSLNYIFKKHKLKIIGEWWFGTDFADLQRTLLNNFSGENSNFFHKNFQKFFSNYINDFQSVLDKNKICSEVHMVVKKSI
jgi:2-polyprenyl-3-methyl-5-hydroxy-6-metoxy-1,4-benzoquinol methylase